MNISVLVAGVCVVVASTISSAQESLTGAISLRDAIDATLSANPQLRSFPLRKEALLGENETASLKPALNIGGNIEDALGTGNLRDFTGAEITLRLSQVIEMGDKRAARIGIVNRRLGLLATEQEVVELDLLGQVVMRFIDVAAAQERVVLQEQATEIAAQTVVLIQPLVTAGRSPQLELNRADAALIRAQTAEQSARALLKSTRIRLANMWASRTPQFDEVESSLLTVGPADSVESILANLESNPNIEIFAGESRLFEAELRQAQSRQQSDIQWSAGIRHLKALDDTALALQVTIPLFSKSRASGAIRKARANIQEVEARRLTALNRITGEISSLYQQLVQAIFEVDSLQQDVIPILENVLQQTRGVYEAGNYSYVELVSAQKEYLDAELSLINSAANAHRFRTEIERLSGLPISGQ